MFMEVFPEQCPQTKKYYSLCLQHLKSDHQLHHKSSVVLHFLRLLELYLSHTAHITSVHLAVHLWDTTDMAQRMIEKGKEDMELQSSEGIVTCLCLTSASVIIFLFFSSLFFTNRLSE